jgi:hypothetical protein
MYSTSKTFVSVAIGLLIDEGKLGLHDKVVSFFPEYVQPGIHPYVAEMTVRDLLLMATPFTHPTYTVKDPHWVKTFFNTVPTHPGGTLFNYDTSGTVVLNAIAEKLSGKNLMEYLRIKILDELGFSKDAWCVERPEGGAWGGSGVLCSTHDLAKFALFLLHKGKWQGRQLLSASYLEEASSPLIDTRTSGDDVEMRFGYGYQIWRTRHNGFATLGMGSQMAICLPQKDLIFLTTGDTQSIPDSQSRIINAFWTEVYPYLEDGKLQENKKALAALNTKLGSLQFPEVDGDASSPKAAAISGKTYILEENPMGIKDIRFVFSGGKGSMIYTNATGNHEISFGLGDYVSGVFPETHYFGRRIGVPSGKGYAYKASGAWFNEASLCIYLYIIDDYFGTLKTQVSFKEDRIAIQMNKVAEWFLDEYEGIAAGKAAL